MYSMTSTCKNCSLQFKITDADRAVHKEFEVPAPTLCSDCRHQRRLAFRNSRNLYQRKCDASGKSILSIYSPDIPFTVYSPEAWWSDSWDPCDYGQEVDFSRPFFEQIREVMERVPLLSNMVWNSTNCEYCIFCVTSKNCYLSTRVGDCEDVFYSYLTVNGNNCFDCYNTYGCELCYECIDCWKCYGSQYLQLCKEAVDSYYCYDCVGVSNCFGCVGLRNAEYHIFNKKVSKEEYEKFIELYRAANKDELAVMLKKFEAAKLATPHRATILTNTEDCTGDFIVRSKDVHEGYDVEEVDTGRYVWGSEFCKNIYDTTFGYYSEHCYEQISNTRSTNILFTFNAIDSHNLTYCLMCYGNTQDCFGCVSMNKKRYCILNKQYSKEEYEALVPRIIEHMKKTGEFGEFMNPQLSPFAYNETVAQEYFPLTKEEVLAKGWRWKEKDKKQYLDGGDLPEGVLSCIECMKNYKIVPQEKVFYKERKIRAPDRCPDCRHRSRFEKRNPKKLWGRACAKCKKVVQTSYAPDRPEIIYCDECYLKEVY